jgi:ABC-type transport system involved in multi-copper enzyme maturation permease subunit
MALVLSVLVGAFFLAMVGVLLVKDVAITSAIIKAVLLSWCEVLVVAAVAIFFSSFSTPFLSGIFALAIWVIGRLTPDIEAATKAASPLIRTITKITLYIVPDLHLFAVSGRTVDGAAATVHGDFVSWSYVGLSSLHAFGWIAGLLAFAAVLFHRRDFV